MNRTQIRRPLRRNNDSARNIGYLVVLILLIAFFMTFGLQVVLRVSSFIADLGRPHETEQNNSTQEVVVSPVLYDIPDATNSAQLAISGSSSGNGTIKIFVNDEEAENMSVNGNEPDFSAIVDL